MTINTIIHSQNFDQGIFGINFRYHIDENGQYWYNFDDIVEVLALKWRVANKIYDDMINEEDKIIFEDSNNKNTNFVSSIKYRFITSEAFDIILKNNSERIKQVREAKLRLEFVDYRKELKEDIDRLNKLAASPLEDLLEIARKVDKVYNSEPIKEILIKDKNLDPSKEKLIEEFREDVYEYMDEETYDVEVQFIKKRPEYNNTQVRYRKHKIESTCPSWLKEVVK